MDFVNKTRVYNKIPRFYDTWINFWSGLVGGGNQMRNCAISLLALVPEDRVIDICCGSGDLALMIRSKVKNGEVIGLDASPALLRLARLKDTLSQVIFLEANALSISYPDEYFDKVVICGALHEMSRKIRQKVLREMYRVTKRGGRVLVVEPAYPRKSKKAKLIFHLLFNFLNPESITLNDMLKVGVVKEIEESGLLVVEQKFSNLGIMQHILSKK